MELTELNHERKELLKTLSILNSFEINKSNDSKMKEIFDRVTEINRLTFLMTDFDTEI